MGFPWSSRRLVASGIAFALAVGGAFATSDLAFARPIHPANPAIVREPELTATFESGLARTEPWQRRQVDLSRLFGPYAHSRAFTLRIDSHPRAAIPNAPNGDVIATSLLSPPAIPALVITSAAPTRPVSSPSSSTVATREPSFDPVLVWLCAFTFFCLPVMLLARRFCCVVVAWPRTPQWVRTSLQYAEIGCSGVIREVRESGRSFAIVGHLIASAAARGATVSWQRVRSRVGRLSLLRSPTAQGDFFARMQRMAWSWTRRIGTSAVSGLSKAYEASWTRRGRWLIGSLRQAAVWTAVVFLLLPAAVPTPLLAGNDLWVGNTDANFSTAANWNPAGAPIAGDVLTFGAAGSAGVLLNNDLTALLSLGGITFNSGASGYTLSGNAITLTGDIIDNSLNPQTISLNIAGTTVRTVSLVNGASLTFSGIVSGTGGGLNLINSSGTGNATVTLSGAGANTNTGAITLNSGVTLNWNKVSPIGATGTALVINGGTIDNASGASITLTNGYPMTWGGDFSLGNVNATGTTRDLVFGSGSPITITSGTRTVNVLGGTYSFGGTVTSSGLGLIKSGNGTLVLSAAINISTGGVTVNEGTLTLSNPIANTYTGDTTVNGGTLKLAGGVAANMSNSAVRLTGGTLDLSTAATVSNIPLLSGSSGTVRLGSNALILGNATNSVAFNGAISGPGAVIKGGTGTVTLGGTNSYSSTSIQSGTLRLDFSQSGAPLSNILSSWSNLTMNGGTLVVAGTTDASNSQAFAGVTVATGASSIAATSGTSGTQA